MASKRAKRRPPFWWSEHPGAVKWGEPGWAPMMGPDRHTLVVNQVVLPEERDGGA